MKTTTVRFWKNVAPLIDVSLDAVEGAIVRVKKWLPEYVIREIGQLWTSDEERGELVLQRAIESWNLVDEDDKAIPINKETIQWLPSPDIVKLFNVVQGKSVGEASTKDEVEKNS